MQNIFLGMLFAFLDFDISLGNRTIGLLPDFVGYLLMIKGLEEMAAESALFEKARPWALGMSVYTGVLYAMAFLAMPVQLRLLNWVMGVAALVASLVISRWILRGILEIEEKRRIQLQAFQLEQLWKPLAIIQLVVAAFGWFPLIGWICALAAFVMSVCYLVAFYKTKNLYLNHIGLR